MNDLPEGVYTSEPSTGRRQAAVQAVSMGRAYVPTHLDELKRRPQWVAHRAKRPIAPHTGRAASSTDPATWSTYDEATALVNAGRADGIGFVLTDGDPYACIDLDNCRDPESGEINPDARAIVEALNSYSEVSPSGTGLHIWVVATIPGKRNRTEHVEMYATKRYMTVTGRPLPGYDVPIRPAQEGVGILYRHLFSESAQVHDPTRPILALDDQDIIDRLRRDKDGHGIAGPLLDGDSSGYPSPSEARGALAFKCCFYTDDHEQIARILLASRLFKPASSVGERGRKAQHDARAAIRDYRGPRYDPSLSHTTSPTALVAPVNHDSVLLPAEADIDALGAEDLRAMLRAAQSRLVAKDRELQAHREVENALQTVLSCEGIEAGPRLTAAGVLLECASKQARGELPTEIGYHVPASWIARRTGQTPKTVSRHLKKLDACGLIDRRVVRKKERIPERTVDDDGVIHDDMREDNGRQNFIAFPPSVADFAARFAA